MCNIAPNRIIISSFSSKHYELTETEHVSLDAHQPIKSYFETSPSPVRAEATGLKSANEM